VPFSLLFWLIALFLVMGSGALAAKRGGWQTGLIVAGIVLGIALWFFLALTFALLGLSR
jgi:hypothetical protein